MATRFLKISSNVNMILKSKLITAPSYMIVFNFSFPFSIESLPECQEVKQAIPFNDLIPNSNPEWDSMMKQKSYVSSYIAGGFASLLLLIILTIALLR